MEIKIFSDEVKFSPGLSTGGYGINFTGNRKDWPLELNGFSFKEGCITRSIMSADTLYAGNLVAEMGRNTTIAASHSHYSPMLDASKPALGIFQPCAVQSWVEAFKNAETKSVTIDCVHVYRAESTVPVYRRLDSSGSAWQRLVGPHIGMIPNWDEPLDRSVRLFLLCSDGVPTFGILWHCCHPVSRRSKNIYSSDFIGALRSGVRTRFGDIPVLFFLGPSGDVRPGVVNKRIFFAPTLSWNRRFKRLPSEQDERLIDQSYEGLVSSMSRVGVQCITNIELFETRVNLTTEEEITAQTLRLTDQISFTFMPFELSHRYHHRAVDNNRLLVSCANDVLGYLPHETQLKFGGYEVDQSRQYMNLERRVCLKQQVITSLLDSNGSGVN